MRRPIHEGLFSNPQFLGRAKETRRGNDDRLNKLRLAYDLIIAERQASAQSPLNEIDSALTSDDIKKAHRRGLCDSPESLSKKIGTAEHACHLQGIPYARKVGKNLVIQKPETNVSE